MLGKRFTYASFVVAIVPVSPDWPVRMASASRASGDDGPRPLELGVQCPSLASAFLYLEDEYSENDLAEALIQHLKTFLLRLREVLPSSAGKSLC
jgi:hypothetical protein